MHELGETAEPSSDRAADAIIRPRELELEILFEVLRNE